MRGGGLVTARKPRAVREIPFTDIEAGFRLGSMWWGSTFKPAVFRKGDGYRIRIVKSETRYSTGSSISYDYFELAADGTVLIAPRGYARDYKPGRIAGLDEAVEKYADAAPGDLRVQL